MSEVLTDNEIYKISFDCALVSESDLVFGRAIEAAVMAKVQADIATLRAEVDEQCRLNGMGSEREAKLRGEVERVTSCAERSQALYERERDLYDRQSQQLAADALDAMAGKDHLMVVAAVRYCLGRMTYIVSDCADWLVSIWPMLDDKTKAIIRRDIDEAFARDDADREAGRDYKALGHDCDRAQWERVRKLWSGA